MKGKEEAVLRIHLAKPLNDLKIRFWDVAAQTNRRSELVDAESEADVVVLDDPREIEKYYRSNADIVVIGEKHTPIPERENVFFIRTHERIKWFLEKVPRRHALPS